MRINPINNYNTNYKKMQSSQNYNQILQNTSAKYSTYPTFKGMIQGPKINPIVYYANKLYNRSVLASKQKFPSIIDELKPYTKPTALKTSDNKILKCLDINPKDSKKYVLFLHGLAQNSHNNQKLYKEMSERGYGVFVLEYRGFGQNAKAKTSEKLLNIDVDTAIEHLNKVKNIPNKDITVIGHSMGSVFAANAGKTHKDLNSIILVAPLIDMKGLVDVQVIKRKDSIPKIMKPIIEKCHFLFNPLKKGLSLEKRITEINSPITVIHATHDNIFPISKVREISKKAPNLKAFIELNDGGHSLNDNLKISTIASCLPQQF